MSKIAALLVLVATILVTDQLVAQGPKTPDMIAREKAKEAADKAAELIKEQAARRLRDLQDATGTGGFKPDRSKNVAVGIRGFAGTTVQKAWVGQWSRTECLEAGGAVGGACASHPSSGALRLTLIDYGSSVGGTTELGTLEVILSGVKNPDGSLGVSGYGRDLSTDVTITNWVGNESGETITGTFTLTFHPDEPTVGAVIVRAEMQKMVMQR